MFEFSLGVVLAALFVAAYFLITGIFGRDKHELGGQHPPVTLNPVDATHAIGSGRSRPALSSGKASDRHHGGGKYPAGEKGGSTR